MTLWALVITLGWLHGNVTGAIFTGIAMCRIIFVALVKMLIEDKCPDPPRSWP